MVKLIGFISVTLMIIVSSVALANAFEVKIGVDDIVLVKTGPRSSTSATIRDLEERIYQLERAVAQLQSKVFRLEYKPTEKPEKKIACYLKSAFDGTFTASGASKNEAIGKVLKACSDKGVAFCNERDVKCDD